MEGELTCRPVVREGSVPKSNMGMWSSQLRLAEYALISLVTELLTVHGPFGLTCSIHTQGL